MPAPSERAQRAHCTTKGWPLYWPEATRVQTGGLSPPRLRACARRTVASAQREGVAARICEHLRG
eukprot:5397323-Pleurochrysis_carterae.AAC.1